MLAVDQLIESAVQQAGLEDFGGDAFMEPLTILVDSLNEEAGYNALGEMRAQMTITATLASRLEVQDFFKRHPDVPEQPVMRPIVIAGQPRTGTTLLHHLLNEDPANHTLRMWEMSHPLPPPEEATYRSDPRIAQTRKEMALTDEVMPGFRVAHRLDAEAPDECIMLFGRSMISVEYSSFYHVPGYLHWIFRQDLRDLYAYFRQLLQLLQYRKSGLWVLKTPMHQLAADALLTHFPDTVIVQTHRDPMSFVASGCSFCEILRRSCADEVDPMVVGRDWMELLETYHHRFREARARLEPQHPGQFVDIRYDELVADPMRQIERLYRCAGRELSAEAEAAMRRWLVEHPQHEHGRHRYTLERYGLSRDDVVCAFGDYARHYHLEIEGECDD